MPDSARLRAAAAGRFVAHDAEPLPTSRRAPSTPSARRRLGVHANRLVSLARPGRRNLGDLRRGIGHRRLSLHRTTWTASRCGTGLRLLRRPRFRPRHSHHGDGRAHVERARGPSRFLVLQPRRRRSRARSRRSRRDRRRPPRKVAPFSTWQATPQGGGRRLVRRTRNAGPFPSLVAHARRRYSHLLRLGATPAKHCAGKFISVDARA